VGDAGVEEFDYVRQEDAPELLGLVWDLGGWDGRLGQDGMGERVGL